MILWGTSLKPQIACFNLEVQQAPFWGRLENWIFRHAVCLITLAVTLYSLIDVMWIKIIKVESRIMNASNQQQFY